MKAYERLLAWKACHDLALLVYHATGVWPAHERYGLVSQARRAAFSAAANIAEGSAKRGPKEFRRFLDASLGSLAELSYIIRLTKELGLLTDPSASALEAASDKAGKLTWGLYARIARAP